MKFKIQIDGAEHQVDAGADGKVVLGGEVFEANVNGPAEDRRVVQLGEKSYEVRVVENCAETGVFVLELAGERIPVTVSEVEKVTAVRTAGGPSLPAPGPAAATPAVAAGGSADEAGGALAGSNGAEASTRASEDVTAGIWAPVPGKIIDVFVKVGDTVEEGAAVLILEAMKMENELHAPAKGTVSAVLVKKGDQAERGQLLVALE